LTPPAGCRDQPLPGAAVEVERVVPASGNLAVRPQQFWFGPALAGRTVRLWISTTTVHVLIDGHRVKTLPSRFTELHLSRLLRTGASPAGPPPGPPSPAMLAAGAAVELERTVTAVGIVALAGHQVQVGSPLAGQRVTLRLEEHLIHVVVAGQLWRTLPSPLEPATRGRLRGARVAGPPPAIPDGHTRVQRRVSCRGGIQVCRQRVQVGLSHAGRIVTIEVDQSVFRILDERDTIIKTVPRTNTQEVTRHKAYGHNGRTA
jgi:hypothetical protein